MSEPDVVFIVREKVARAELQYALRSLANIPHGKVWLIGGKPEWVVNVEHVPFPDNPNKWQNISDKFKSLAHLDGLSERFIYTEDDYFIVKPFDRLPYLVRPAMLNDWVANYEKGRKRKKLSGWPGYLQATRDALHAAGITDPYSFDLHIPMEVERSKIPLHMDTGRPISWRSMCGNTSGREVEVAPRDVKIGVPKKVATVLKSGIGFLSSSDASFAKCVEPTLRRIFPEPCRYEKEYYMAYEKEVHFEPESPWESPVYEDEESVVEEAEPGKCRRCGKPRDVTAKRIRRGKPNIVYLVCGHTEEQD